MALKLPPAEAVNLAIQSIGCGYDMTLDLRLTYHKPCYVSDSVNNPYRNCRLIEIEEDEGRDIVLPGGFVIPNVPESIECEFDKGDRTRIQSGVLSFKQMSEQFNQEISLLGRIPSGLFNTMFELSGSWHKDESSNKTLAFDGVFVSLYTVALEKSRVVLCDHVKKAVPLTWEPVLLARFIEKFGTHIIVGVKMGGKDVIYMKQKHASSLKPTDVEKKLKEMADDRFLDTDGKSVFDFKHVSQNDKDLVSICKRRGGSDDTNLKHNEWLRTVQLEPDVIMMSFIPITSLLDGVSGRGYLSHAINLYLRYKPPLKELCQFLHFQLPRRWVASYDDQLIGPNPSTASLRFSFFGPKIHVNTDLVDVGKSKSAVTGLRLYLEGERKDRIGIRLQHISLYSTAFQIEDSVTGISDSDLNDRRYYKKVDGRCFSHVCTAPVESEDESLIVTGAQLQVGDHGSRKALFLRLRFSKLLGCTTASRKPEWDASPRMKSEIMAADVEESVSGSEASTNTNFWIADMEDTTELMRKMMKFVDTTEMTRGPQDSPGYWVVSGARLVVDKGKISVRVKYSLPRILAHEEVTD